MELVNSYGGSIVEKVATLSPYLVTTYNTLQKKVVSRSYVKLQNMHNSLRFVHDGYTAVLFEVKGKLALVDYLPKTRLVAAIINTTTT